MIRLNTYQKRVRSFRIFVAILMLIVVYEFYVLAVKVYMEYQVNLQIHEAEDQRDLLLRDNAEKEKELQYLQSDEYKELMAKGSLNLKKPGEEVFVIDGGITSENKDKSEQDVYDNLPISERWWKYFVDD